MGILLTTTSLFNGGDLRFKYIDPEYGQTQAERVIQIFKSINCVDTWMGMAFGSNDFFHVEQNLESLSRENLSQTQVLEYFD